MKKILLFVFVFLFVSSFFACKQGETPNTEMPNEETPPAVKTYTVTFYANNGTDNSYTQTFTEGISQNLKANTFTAPSGKLFTGWASSPSANFSDLCDKSDYSTTKDESLYATWINNASIEKLVAILNGTVLTVKPTVDGTGENLKKAMHSVVTDENRPTITKIVFDIPDNTKVIPGFDLSALFSNPQPWGTSKTQYRNLVSIEGFEHIDITNVSNMWMMFANCSSLKEINLTSYSPQKANHMAEMFANCTSLKSLDLSTFNVENADTMYGMFYNCSSLTLVNLSNWKPPVYVSDPDLGEVPISAYEYMFDGCTKLLKQNVIIENATLIKEIQDQISNLPESI